MADQRSSETNTSTRAGGLPGEVDVTARDTDGRGRVVDLFAGPGGWSEGLRALGISDIGIEHDMAAYEPEKAST